MKTVLFLCTGNYYRSRFAEIFFNSLTDKFGLGWRADSRGLALERGSGNIGPIAAEAVRALEAKAISAEQATSRFPVQVNHTDLRAAAWIVALKEVEHLPLVEERFPEWTSRVEFWHVDDEPGALPLIEREVLDLVARLLGGGRPRKAGLFPVDEQPAAVSLPATASPPVKKRPMVKVGRETAGRRGKGVTTIFDTPLDEAGLNQLAATVKQRCGTGGSVKAGRIEIQGDQRERIIAMLEQLGYQVKRAGG